MKCHPVKVMRCLPALALIAPGAQTFYREHLSPLWLGTGATKQILSLTHSKKGTCNERTGYENTMLGNLMKHDTRCIPTYARTQNEN